MIYPYRFSFSTDSQRVVWIRFGANMNAVLELAKEAARKEYPDARSFLIESDQGGCEEIHKAWGIK